MRDLSVHEKCIIQVIPPPFSLFEDSHEPEHSCLNHFLAEVMPLDDNMKMIPKQTIGEVWATHINTPKFFNKEDIETCLLHILLAANYNNIAEHLIDPHTHDLYDDFQENFPEYQIFDGILVIDSVDIKPKYKNQDLELSILYQLIDRYNFGSNLILMEVNSKKKRDYYSRLGFKQFENSNILIMCRAFIQPDLKEVLSTEEDWKKSKQLVIDEFLKEEKYEQAATLRDIMNRGRKVDVLKVEQETKQK